MTLLPCATARRLGDLGGDVGYLLSVQRLPRHVDLQRGPVEPLHGDEGTAVKVVHVVDGADIRVVEERNRLSLAPQPPRGVRIVSQLIRQELQRDPPRQTLVFGVVDHPHPTYPQLADDAVMGHGAADHRGQDTPGSG